MNPILIQQHIPLSDHGQHLETGPVNERRRRDPLPLKQMQIGDSFAIYAHPGAIAGYSGTRFGMSFSARSDRTTGTIRIWRVS